MFLSRSFWRKVVATVGAAVGFVFVYETTIRDSRYAARQAMRLLLEDSVEDLRRALANQLPTS